MALLTTCRRIAVSIWACHERVVLISDIVRLRARVLAGKISRISPWDIITIVSPILATKVPISHTGSANYLGHTICIVEKVCGGLQGLEDVKHKVFSRHGIPVKEDMALFFIKDVAFFLTFICFLCYHDTGKNGQISIGVNGIEVLTAN